MTGPKRYGIYTARFPFLEIRGEKIRPVIVISAPHSEHNIVVIVPISSKSGLEAIDVKLGYWQDEGLMKPSVARVHRLTSMLQSDLLAELGQLTERDAALVRKSLQKLLELS